jgi:hypothetical protein
MGGAGRRAGRQAGGRAGRRACAGGRRSTSSLGHGWLQGGRAGQGRAGRARGPPPPPPPPPPLRLAGHRPRAGAGAFLGGPRGRAGAPGAGARPAGAAGQRWARAPTGRNAKHEPGTWVRAGGARPPPSLAGAAKWAPQGRRAARALRAGQVRARLAARQSDAAPPFEARRHCSVAPRAPRRSPGASPATVAAGGRGGAPFPPPAGGRAVQRKGDCRAAALGAAPCGGPNAGARRWRLGWPPRPSPHDEMPQ